MEGHRREFDDVGNGVGMANHEFFLEICNSQDITSETDSLLRPKS